MNIGEKIRKIRELRDYSQENMASQLNMTQTNYSKIERGGTKEITVNRLEKIAKVLEVAPGDILDFDEKQVFNSTSNNHSGDSIIMMKTSFERERKQYETQIKHLEEEITFLREMCKSKK